MYEKQRDILRSDDFHTLPKYFLILLIRNENKIGFYFFGDVSYIVVRLGGWEGSVKANTPCIGIGKVRTVGRWEVKNVLKNADVLFGRPHMTQRAAS